MSGWLRLIFVFALNLSLKSQFYIFRFGFCCRKNDNFLQQFSSDLFVWYFIAHRSSFFFPPLTTTLSLATYATKNIIIFHERVFNYISIWWLNLCIFAFLLSSLFTRPFLLLLKCLALNKNRFFFFSFFLVLFNLFLM